MNITFNKIIIGLTSSLFLASCGGGGGSKETAYDGEWISTPACYYDSDDEESVVDVVNISGDSLVMDTKIFVTSDCSGSPIGVSKLNFSLDYGDDKPSVSSICGNTREVDVTLTGGTINGTVVPVEKLVKNLGVDAKVYDLICSSHNKLYFGDDSEDATDGTTSEKRPTSLKEDTYLVKKFKG